MTRDFQMKTRQRSSRDIIESVAEELSLGQQFLGSYRRKCVRDVHWN
jgi:hypothetical protein